MYTYIYILVNNMYIYIYIYIYIDEYPFSCMYMYAVGNKLGEGMVGVIYEAKWRGSAVAVKRLREGFVIGTQESKDLIQVCMHAGSVLYVCVYVCVRVCT
jgi:hypothetical protein